MSSITLELSETRYTVANNSNKVYEQNLSSSGIIKDDYLFLAKKKILKQRDLADEVVNYLFNKSVNEVVLPTIKPYNIESKEYSCIFNSLSYPQKIVIAYAKNIDFNDGELIITSENDDFIMFCRDDNDTLTIRDGINYDNGDVIFIETLAFMMKAILTAALSGFVLMIIMKML